MIRHFCTLFDSKYLPQGLALYSSLARHCSEPFKLWILALDRETVETLARLQLPHTEIIDGDLFERDLQLTAIRRSRTHQEYCWSLASQLCESLLYGGLLEVTYADADTFFFSDTEPLFSEIGHRSIAITPHRLIPSKKHLEINGLFNVGVVHFRNTEVGRKCVERWAAQCREKCSAADGCGDQKYLDEWPTRYGPECCIIENIGVNAGPWSIGNWKVTEGPRLDGVQVIAYHAHEFDAATGRLTNYELSDEDRRFIYAPYIEAVSQARERLARIPALA